MRVTALLFASPGRGEFLRMHMDMPETGMPKTVEEFATRSFNAMRHFWPQASVTRALTIDKCEGGKRYVVEGREWSCEWATDQHVTEMRHFMEKYMNGQASSDDFIDTMMNIQPTQRVEL